MTEKPNPLKNHSTLLRAHVFSVLILFFLIITNDTTAHCSIEDAPYDKAVELYSTIAEGDTATQEKWEQIIRSLPYTNLVVFREFCAIPNILTSEIQSTVLKLQKVEIRYEAATLLGYFCAQPGVTTALAWQFLKRLQTAPFVTGNVLGSLKEISIPSAPLLFPLIDKVEQLGEAGKWAAKALFKINKISYSGIAEGLNILTTLTNPQNWAAERFCMITGINESTALIGLREIHKLSFGNSWTSRSLFLDPEITPNSALSWLINFLILPEEKQQHSFLTLSKGKKATLLTAYVDASDKLIWQINNLHDVTDDFGREIGNYRLKRLSFPQLLSLFTQLNKKSQRMYRKKIDKAIAMKNKDTTIKILHLTTEQARKETAQKLTGSNIYILLARGNDLYDSSFRDILVPVLRQRMGTFFENDLISFLRSTDPGNSYSSNFITNLAQKGKLTQFLPKDLDKQKILINLVAHSAFEDQDSLILFSATFIKLLQLIDPEVRSHLIDIMLGAINTDDSTLSSQLRVILQHYIEQHKKLLSSSDKRKISTMIQEKGEISIGTFRQTRFAEWLKDNVLQSLSVFQRDDDGIGSFFSYCRALIKNGYHPSLSKDYKLAELDPEQKKELTALAAVLRQQSKNNLSLLFGISAKMPIVIDWQKRLNGTEIKHSVFIYQDEGIQKELIAQFLRSGHEMFAQRGHSYWRYEQLIAPFEALEKTKTLNSTEIWEKQRFLSIGSCGGIKVYRKLNRLFRNRVDILATTGTGKASINNPYNIALFEIVATGGQDLTWDDISEKTTAIFSQHQGGEYLQPGSLPAILYKMVYTN